ncbi:alcohol dehydrogenase superfamily protein [Roridomyces roridus]|uniref:Alcohol dehydrogenase superfamily protein n=1 Tax=Roridomyces roridus TaxID=1738132 RepID=A0AAD7BAD9_9AGAR|nr:alcohol dehydrogenase superfamily protein [Roridomyces roridus]
MSLPTTTRQYSYPQRGSYNNLVLTEVPIHALKANEVLVKTHVVSLQYRDLLISYEFKNKIPDNLVPLSDMAGQVLAVGSDVRQWKVGDRVCSNFMLDKTHDELSYDIIASALGGAQQGVLTEYRHYPGHALVAIPEHLSYEEAATLPCAAATVWNAFMGGFERVKVGDTILVQGTGGVSIFAIQFAVAAGATVIATSSSDEKLKVATRLGAKHVINYNTNPAWDEEVLRLTNGRGVDRVIEVAGNSTIGRSMEATRLNGSVDIIGIIGGTDTAPPGDMLLTIMFKGLKLRGIYVASIQQLKDMMLMIQAHPEATRPVIDRVLDFEDTKSAFAHFESQAHIGKVVIKF